MKKTVRKFHSLEEADEAEYAYYKSLSGDEKLQMLLEFIMPENSNEAIIKRSARVHPLTDDQKQAGDKP